MLRSGAGGMALSRINDTLALFTNAIKWPTFLLHQKKMKCFSGNLFRKSIGTHAYHVSYSLMLTKQEKKRE